MASEIDICNLALSNIGKYPIQSFEDDIKEAKECKLHYPFARDTVLRDFPWNFATKRLTLAELSEDYEGWDYAYQYPSDCIRALSIYNSASKLVEDKIPFDIGVTSDLASKIIFTDQSSAVLLYTAKVTNPNVFDPLFIDALGYRLASDLAQPLRGSLQVQQAMIKLYASLLGRAQLANANENVSTPDDSCSFLKARL